MKNIILFASLIANHIAFAKLDMLGLLIVWEIIAFSLWGLFKADQVAQSIFGGPEYTSELDSKTIIKKHNE